MRGFPVQPRLKRGLFLAFALTAGLGLTACSDIDNLFGDEGDATADAGPPPDAGGFPAVAAPVASAAPVTTGGGLAPALALQIGGQAHQGPTFEAVFQGGAPGFGAGSGLIRALGGGAEPAS